MTLFAVPASCRSEVIEHLDLLGKDDENGLFGKTRPSGIRVREDGT